MQTRAKPAASQVGSAHALRFTRSDPVDFCWSLTGIVAVPGLGRLRRLNYNIINNNRLVVKNIVISLCIFVFWCLLMISFLSFKLTEYDFSYLCHSQIRSTLTWRGAFCFDWTFLMDGFTRTEPPLSRACVGPVLSTFRSSNVYSVTEFRVQCLTYVLTYVHRSRARPVPSLPSSTLLRMFKQMGVAPTVIWLLYDSDLIVIYNQDINWRADKLLRASERSERAKSFQCNGKISVWAARPGLKRFWEAYISAINWPIYMR